MTWTALLGKWVQFAQASLALAPGADGDRWRASVVSVINLQAVTFALADLESLSEADRPVARDKAALLIDEAAIQIAIAWKDVPIPEALAEMESDAKAALLASQTL